MFGGNSNWRGPIWFPVNAILIRAMLQYYLYYGDEFTVECPTGSGNRMTLFEVAKEISERLSRVFLRDDAGRRPVFGGSELFQNDPHWRDHLLFYEYFHGDNGAGIGASHQTGWTGLVAKGIQLFATLDAKAMLGEGMKVGFAATREAAAPAPGATSEPLPPPGHVKAPQGKPAKDRPADGRVGVPTPRKKDTPA